MEQETKMDLMFVFGCKFDVFVYCNNNIHRVQFSLIYQIYYENLSEFSLRLCCWLFKNNKTSEVNINKTLLLYM